MCAALLVQLSVALSSCFVAVVAVLQLVRLFTMGTRMGSKRAWLFGGFCMLGVLLLPHAACRCRPGDPFFDEQQEEQRELAAMAAEAEVVAAPRPAAMAMPAPTFGTGKGTGGAIPGIGAAVAMPVLPQVAPFDVFSIRQAEPSEARGGRPPADGGPAAAAAAMHGGREGRGQGQDERGSSRWVR